MIGEWSKERTFLSEDPKTIFMVDYLRAQPAFASRARLALGMADERYRPDAPPLPETAHEFLDDFVARRLIRVWRRVAEFAVRDGEDAVVELATPGAIDGWAGVPHFGEAMVAVRWAVVEENDQGQPTLRFPSFKRWNPRIGAAAQPRAERSSAGAEGSAGADLSPEEKKRLRAKRSYERRIGKTQTDKPTPAQAAQPEPANLFNQPPAEEPAQSNASLRPVCAAQNSADAKVCAAQTSLEERRSNIHSTSTTAAPSAEEIQGEWNQVAKARQLSPCHRMGSERLASYRKRLEDPYWLAHWREALQKVAGLTWIRGENPKQWVADIDWFLRPRTVGRLLEGKYDDKPDRPGGIFYGRGKPANQTRVHTGSAAYEHVGQRVTLSETGPPDPAVDREECLEVIGAALGETATGGDPVDF